MTGASPSGAKKLGRSHPIFEPKQAPAASTRSWTGDRRNGRAVVNSRLGHGTE